MDPLNIIAAVNVVALFGASVSSAKKGLRTSVTAVKEKPKTYLQQVPNIAAAILLLNILGLFQLGTLHYEPFYKVRITALAVYIVFSWLQIWASKSLGSMYAQDIVVLKNHVLVKRGLYKIIRHPQYMTQIFADAALCCVTLSYLSAPVLVAAIPLFILRAAFEDELLEKHFKNEFTEYKKKTGFFFPFL